MWQGMELAKMSRCFPAPWREEKFSGGYVVRDATGQALAYLYARSTESEAIAAKQLTMDEARRIAVSIARLLELEKSETRPWVGLRSISRAILRRRKPMRVHPR